MAQGDIAQRMDKVRVERVTPQDSEIEEEWLRITDEKDIFGMCATRSKHEQWPWRVSIYAAEYIRKEPLESKLASGITTALNAVPGVRKAVQEDREVWVIAGHVDGEALIQACAMALDGMAEELLNAVAQLRSPRAL